MSTLSQVSVPFTVLNLGALNEKLFVSFLSDARSKAAGTGWNFDRGIIKNNLSAITTHFTHFFWVRLQHAPWFVGLRHSCRGTSSLCMTRIPNDWCTCYGSPTHDGCYSACDHFGGSPTPSEQWFLKAGNEQWLMIFMVTCIGIDVVHSFLLKTRNWVGWSLPQWLENKNTDFAISNRYSKERSLASITMSIIHQHDLPVITQHD